MKAGRASIICCIGKSRGVRAVYRNSSIAMKAENDQPTMFT